MKNSRNIIDCKFCSSPSRYHFSKLSSLDHNSYEIYKCSNCKSMFVYPPVSPKYLLEFYQSNLSKEDIQRNYSYQDILNKEKMYPNASIESEIAISKIKELSIDTGNLLDIGAGNGWFSKAAKENNFKVTAIEINDERIKIFKKMNNFDPIKTDLSYEFVIDNKDKFDVIILSQVLEHIEDPQEFLGHINDLLKKDGIFYLAVPNARSLLSLLLGKNDFFIIPPEHLNFFSRKGLLILLEKEGFRVVHMESRSRITEERIRKIFRFNFISSVASSILNFFLKICDRLNIGMITNVYLKKR